MDTKSVKESQRPPWILKLLVPLMIPPLFLVAFVIIEHLRGHIALARYVRTLSSQGEKISARRFILPVPQGENGAPEILAAAKELTPGQVLPKTYPPRMRLTLLGRAVMQYWPPSI